MDELNIASVSLGILLFGVALALFARTWRASGGQRAWWFTLATFVVGFLVGYMLWLSALVTDHLLVATDLLVSQIFLWGAVFVLITARLFERTVQEQRDAEAARLMLERKMLHGQKLESLGVLAGGIAHDFNNLLVGILGHASLALRDADEDTRLHRSLSQVETSALRAADLTRQLLAYSGKGHFHVQPLDISSLVDEMMSLTAVTIHKKAKLRLDLEEDLPPVDADATQLQQIVLNLVTNASDALGPSGGRITVSTSQVDADAQFLAGPWLPEPVEPGSYVCLEISDTGAGIAPETLARMFEPFFSTKGAGRGLGLSAVLGIVQGHRGALRIYTEPEQGTSFKVIFPASASTLCAPQHVQKPASRSFAGGLALFVDDDPAVLELGQEVLRRLGFTVLGASDGQAAVKLFEQCADGLSLVVLDMTMPALDGAETFHKMHELHPGIPTILSSGYNENDATGRLAGQTPAGFLQKPWTAQQLEDAVFSAVGSAPQPD